MPNNVPILAFADSFRRGVTDGGSVCEGLLLQGPTGATGSYIRVAIYKSNHI